jgi:hypothetical protein
MRLTLDHLLVNLTVPLEAGTLILWSEFYVHLGLQIGAQFCPACPP